MKKFGKFVTYGLVMLLVFGMCAAHYYVMWRGAAAAWEDFQAWTATKDSDTTSKSVSLMDRPGIAAVVDELPANSPSRETSTDESSIPTTAEVRASGGTAWLPGIMHEAYGATHPFVAMEEDTSYVLEVSNLPEGFMQDGTAAVLVRYPASIKAGEIGSFRITFSANGRDYYCLVDVEADDDVTLIHGSSAVNMYSGGEVSYNDQTKTLELYFYSSAADQQLDRPQHVERSSSYGHLAIDFVRISDD